MGKRRSSLKSLPTVFIDSSAFFTAVNSPSGGSAKVFSLHNKTHHLLTSKLVLMETERNVRKKLFSFHLERFFILAQTITILKQAPQDNIIQEAQEVIVKKDAVILAEAKQSQADYLLTLDIKHFHTPKARKFISPTKIVTPQELLTTS